jgi:hypothetical protein
MRIAAARFRRTPGIAGKFLRWTSRHNARHPDKKEEVMGHHKQKGGSAQAREAPRRSAEKQPHDRQPDSDIGGREFGQVIEPMQAQMASENDGLAEPTGTKKPLGAGSGASGGGKKRKVA